MIDMQWKPGYPGLHFSFGFLIEFWRAGLLVTTQLHAWEVLAGCYRGQVIWMLEDNYFQVRFYQH